jgi:cellulose synthase/poly-beta-1,6-N-acetylglucosamine synthase-like glycosyltransferase
MLELALQDVLSGLTEQSALGLFLMFWYVLLLEVPRYTLAAVALGLVPNRNSNPVGARRVTRQEIASFAPRVSVVVAGLNEAKSIETCVRSLRAQSFNDFEIVIVSDGSTDCMYEVASRLVRQGLADRAFRTDLRCGKSSGVNLAFRFSSGDIVINVDCDCSYDRFAIERIVSAFVDPRVGCAAGDIVPRNGNASFISAVQVIEYLTSISLGKRIGVMLGMVVCASGAFSAFRRAAIGDIGFLDPGGGEDLDVTMRLRKRGWKVAFASDAVCYTDVPVSDLALMRQRMRWERDAIRVRFRKHLALIMPTSHAFNAREAVHQLDCLLFNIVLSIAFPLYLIFLWTEMGSNLLYLLCAVQIGMTLLDCSTFLTAVAITRRWSFLRYLIFVPGYSLLNTVLMRSLRICAYMQEWVFDESRRDSHYVPLRVQRARFW